MSEGNRWGEFGWSRWEVDEDLKAKKKLKGEGLLLGRQGKRDGGDGCGRDDWRRRKSTYLDSVRYWELGKPWPATPVEPTDTT